MAQEKPAKDKGALVPANFSNAFEEQTNSSNKSVDLLKKDFDSEQLGSLDKVMNTPYSSRKESSSPGEEPDSTMEEPTLETMLKPDDVRRASRPPIEIH